MRSKGKSKGVLRGTLFVLISSFLFVGCGSSNYNYYKDFNKSGRVNPKLTKGQFSPTGMVYIPSGMVEFKSSNGANSRQATVSPFYIDEAEVSNRQFRSFTEWVTDSVAVTDFIKEDRFFKKNASGLSVIDWTAVRRYSPLWKSIDKSIVEKVKPMSSVINGELVLNKGLISYTYSFLKSNSEAINVLVTETIPIFPTDNIWSKDFPNSQMEIMDWNYYNDNTYDNHPVVGVSWKQARAFADWRGKVVPMYINGNPYLPKSKIVFSLPTEAQWQLAATSQNGTAFYNNSADSLKKSELVVNFKQGEGDYGRDGGTFTLPVRSYYVSSNGLYNAEGNVSEWTLDAYSPSSSEFTNDLNPLLKYDAENDESDVMKRKVIRGGSWKDNASEVSSKTRSYDLQDASHSYIGFRCVLNAYELPTSQVKTRLKSDKKNNK